MATMRRQLKKLVPSRSGAHTSSSSSGDRNRRREGELVRTDAEWRAVLSWREYRVLRQGKSEPAWTGDLNRLYPETGYFACRGCEAPLYAARQKFDSRCGWPAFDGSLPGAVKRHLDVTVLQVKMELRCANCRSHLGHVLHGHDISDENAPHCINSVSLLYVQDSAPPNK